MKTPSLLLLCLIPAIPALAADPVHDVRSDKAPHTLDDYYKGDQYLPSDIDDSKAVISWQEKEKEKEAFLNVQVTASNGTTFEFRLVQVTSSNDKDSIEGLFDIYRNGFLVCDDCVGEAYSLSVPVGDYYKLYVGTPSGFATNWLVSGYLTDRFDY